VRSPAGRRHRDRLDDRDLLRRRRPRLQAVRLFGSVPGLMISMRSSKMKRRIGALIK
jgi:hypothetical protein